MIHHTDTHESRYYTPQEVEEIDRNARAYGWSVGMGAPMAATIHDNTDNPFLDPRWRDHIIDDTATLSRDDT